MACCVDLDYSALNTYGNAVQTRRWALEHGFHSLIVVTSAYHMPRALAELAHQLPDVALIPYPVVSDRLRVEPWWSNGATTRLVMSEYLKYLAAKCACGSTPLRNQRIAAGRTSPSVIGEIALARRETSSAQLKSRSPVSRSFAIYLRSVAFTVLFYANLIVHMIVALPTLALPYPATARFHPLLHPDDPVAAARRLRHRRGVARRRKIPKTPCIVACKHQSLWETFALNAVLDDPIYVLKRELMWIPLFGWYMWKAGSIPVDRSAGMAALARMTAHAQKALAGPRPRQLVIFPEGTRRPPGAEPAYKPGIVHLYNRAGLPCVPVALNSGVFWPRRSLRRLPGTIVVEFLDPIPAGLDRKNFLPRLQDAIETACARLLQETGNRD